MDPATIFAIAVGLAMDAFSVSIAYGMTTNGNNKSNALKMASSFGVFQMVMPVLGWLVGTEIYDFIAGFDHWLAFGLLLIIGCRMIYESTKPKHRLEGRTLTFCILLLLSIATSIDALAIGLSFAFIKVSIVTPVIVIGVVTFVLSLTGGFLGYKFRRLRIDKIEIFGGLILIAIGVKILLEHLMLG